jgi:hypothetical protein
MKLITALARKMPAPERGSPVVILAIDRLMSKRPKHYDG